MSRICIQSRRYYAHLYQAWNRGRLPKSLYKDPGSLPAPKQTGYKSSFASKSSGADVEALRSAREDVDSATYGPSPSTNRTLPNSRGVCSQVSSGNPPFSFAGACPSSSLP
ncbi:hypothetical protein EDD15DRAFT_2244689 [Pisolithus albus]|nr:hypothetical protein EDD15DRAFT_2244689 [Pisolithus albus]